jgi:virginiamycin B lyase
MTRTRQVAQAAAILIVLLLAGCRSAPPGEPPPGEPPAAATPTAAQAASQAAAPSPTAAPADTAEPAATPEPTGEPANEPTGEPAATATAAPTEHAIPTFTVPTIHEFPVPAGSHPHDVAPAPDGTVWYTAQATGELGRLDPATGQTHHIPLGSGSAPHGVIVGPDGAAWVTDSGLNAIVRVDAISEEVTVFPLPAGSANANLNTAALDGRGVLWFTGQSGIYGRLDPATGAMDVWDAPRGRGPYGIDATPSGDIYYVSLAGSYLGQVDLDTGEVTVLDPPTAGQGARRVWSDSQGVLWISEWNAGQLGRYDPVRGQWLEWRLPGDNPQPYAVYVDEWDRVWISDFGANALVRFDPLAEEFETFSLPSPGAAVRQILGRTGEVWGAESGADKLVLIRTQ